MNVIGHEPVLAKLYPILNSDGGSYLFHGPPSVGKRTTAFELSREILCVESRAPDCTCASCVRIDSSHPDFLCIGRNGKIKVEDSDKILDFVSTRPFLSRYKCAVIDNADSMTWEAANRLLKTLEEPPPGMFFFLVASNLDAVISTILSRCIKYGFGHLSAEDITNVLWKKMHFDLPKARIIGWIASGTPADVFSKAGVYLKYRDMAYDMIANIRNRSLIDCLDVVDKIDKSELGIFVDMLVMILTDFLIVKSGLKQVINVDLKDSLIKATEPFADRGLIAAVSIMSQVKKDSYLNVNLNLALKNAFIKSYPMLVA